MLSLETVRPAVSRVRSLVQQWQATNSFTDRAALFDPLAEAVAELAELIDTDSAHPDCWPIVLEADELATRARDWLDSLGALSPEVSAAAESAAQAAQEPEPEQLPPPIEDLRAQGRTLAQIAAAWRWFCVAESGAAVPDSARVVAALADHAIPRTPGPDPRTLRDQLAVEAKWESRTRARKGVQNRPCPESISRLLEEGVSVRQVCKMHGCTIADVQAVAKELGRTTEWDPPQKPSRFAPSPEVILAGINSHAEHGQNGRARARAIAADGRSPGLVSQVLRRNGFPGATLEIVRKWLADDQVAVDADE